MRLIPMLIAAAALAACAEAGARRADNRPAPRLNKVAIRQIANISQQPTLEDTLAGALRDEFLRDARIPLVPESEADGIVAITITRYTLTPIQYDSKLVLTTYRLSIVVDVAMIEKSTGKTLWTEKDLEGAMIYPASTLAGGSTETAQSAQIWSLLSPMIVQRVLEGRD